MNLAAIRSNYLGALLLLCLVLGGGTQKGLPTVFALELLALPLALDLAARPGRSGSSWPVNAMACIIMLCFALQFVPVLSPNLAFVSRDPGRTIDSLIYVIFALTLFYSFGRIAAAERNRMIAWFLTGVILNVALALTQFAASRGLTVGLFPYTLGAGFFANANHFSSLLYVAIPFVIYQFDAVGRLPWSILALLLIVFVEFAAGSTAGILLSIGCAMVSVALVGRVGPRVRWVLLSISLLGAAFLALNPGNVLHLSPDDPLDRPQIALTTFAAVLENLPLGSGYGTFDIVYPSAERDTAISTTFVNHAHNEPLELVLEGGIPAAVAILAYLALLLWRLPIARQSPLSVAAFCSIGFVLVHSLVDYPLRSAGLIAVFALLNAIYFAADSPELPSRRRRQTGSGAERSYQLPIPR